MTEAANADPNHPHRQCNRRTDREYQRRCAEHRGMERREALQCGQTEPRGGISWNHTAEHSVDFGSDEYEDEMPADEESRAPDWPEHTALKDEGEKPGECRRGV